MTSGNGSTRAVLYLRMSNEHQEQSIPSQRTELTSYAKRQGYTIVGEYIDVAIFGDDTHQRAGFLAMRDDAAIGNFNVVLCWDQDRFGRFDILDAGYWIMPFRQAIVRLETIAQGKIDWEDLVGQLIYSVNQMGKAQFLRDLARNTTRGLLTAAKEGRAGTGGPNPYGYYSKDGHVSIVEGEGKIVRWIFTEYLKPKGSLRGIAAELNRRQVSAPRGRTWRDSSVRAILTRRKYTGTFVYGDRNAGKYYCWRDGEIVPRRRTDRTVSSKPIVIENKFEAIVEQTTFDKTQVKLESRKGCTARKQARQYLLSGLVRCGDCAGAMGGLVQNNKTAYRCSRYHRTGRSCCHCNTIHEAPLVDCIVRKIQEQYLSESAIDRLRDALREEQQRGRPRPRDLNAIHAQIETLDRKIDRGADRVLEAPDEIVPTLYRKLEELKAERDQLQAELASSNRATKSQGSDQAEVERAIDELKCLGVALTKADPADTKRLLSSIVTRIELHFQDGTGRRKRDFTHGTIYVRPNAGGGAAAAPSRQPTHMSNIRMIFKTHRPISALRFWACF